MFVSLDSLKRAVKELIVPGSASILTNFLSLKYTGISTEWSPCFTDQWKDLAYESVIYLMFLYEENEKLPDRYQLMLPFEMEWHTQSISEPAASYARGRIKNNVDGGTPVWKEIVEIDRSEEPLRMRFMEGYLQRIRENCLEDTHVDIKLLAGWVLRGEDLWIEKNTNKELTMYAVRIFKRLFNITPQEESEIFRYDTPNLVFTNSRAPMSEVRKALGDPPRPQSFEEDSISEIEVPETIKGLAKAISSKNPNLDEIHNLLLSGKQLILFGPPGTSKTFYARKIGEQFFKDTTTFIQFHQSYGYEEFIGGLRPQGNSFKPVPGLLTNLASQASSENQKRFLLIIDEINRGNISKIMGEAIVCLDRDSPPVQLSFNPSIELKLPENLHIIGTMNSTDRQIALVDYALRRRFEFVYLKPDSDVLANYTNDRDLGGISILALFDRINQRIKENLNEDFLIGQTYFMPPRIFDNKKGEYVWSMPELQRVINYSILPIIEEYCYGNRQMLTSILGPDLPSRLSGKDFKTALENYLK